MQTQRIIRAGAALLALSPLCLSLPAVAQLNGGAPQAGVRRPAPKNYFTDLKDIGDAMGKQYEARVVVDPAIWVATKPAPPPQNVQLPAALDALVGQLKQVAWRRIYLSQGLGGALPPPEKLAQTVRALELVDQTGLVLENPATRRITTYFKNSPAPQNLEDSLAQEQMSPAPIYVIYSTNPNADATKSVEDRFYDLQRQQMDMMMQMDQDQLSQALGRGMQLWQNMDPDVRGQFMGQMMRAGMQMFMNMPADQRQQLINQAMQNAGQMFGGGAGAPGRP